MTAQRISAINLLRSTFNVVGSLYLPLLIINSPHLIWFVLNTFGRDALLLHIMETTGSRQEGPGTYQVDSIYRLAEVPFWIYWLVAVPFLSGATNFYTYRSLTENQVTVSEAFQQAKRRLLPLIGVYFLSVVLILGLPGLMWFLRSLAFLGLILVIIPSLYVFYRLIFSSYATVIDNSSVPDSLDSSWKLTQGRWWLIFRSNLLMAFVFLVPAILISELIGSKLDNSLESQVVSQVLGFIAGLLMNVYLVLLYLRLRESAATIQ